MSHFSVLVIGDGVEKKLAPYNENIEVEPYERECKCGLYKAEHQACEQARDELGFDNFDDFWAKARKRDGGKELERKYHERAEVLLEANPDKEKPNPEYEECGGTGTRTTDYNPKSKWDWHEIGGRWRGMLLLKPGCKGYLGRPGIFDNEPERPEGVDQARFGDIDWERIQNDDTRKLELEREWDELINPPKDKPSFYKPEYYLERFGTKENFVKRLMLFATYAVVTPDGEWHEAGKMGWWGMSSDTAEDKEAWDLGYRDKFLKDLSPDTLITVVDCHI